MFYMCLSQRGLLATYLILGCVGRGVRLGSENASTIHCRRRPEIWKSEFWESEYLQAILSPNKTKRERERENAFEIKSILPKMSIRSCFSKLWKNTPEYFWGQLRHFPMGHKHKKTYIFVAMVQQPDLAAILGGEMGS